MKLTTNRKQLISALQLAAGVADRRGTMPVLSNALLTATKGKLTVSATDLSRALTVTLDADVGANGCICLPVKDLLDRARMMPGDVVAIDDEVVKAPGTKRRYKLHSIPGEEFPKMPEPSADAPHFTIDGEKLVDLIEATQPAVSTDETRLHLNSMLLETSADGITAVATDGHRLAIRKISLAGIAPREILIRNSVLLELKKLAADGDVKLTVDVLWLFAEVNGARLAVKTPDAKFPPWRQVLPETTEHTAKAPRLQLSDALKAVELAADSRTGGVRLTFAPGTLLVSAESPETGEASDSVVIEYEGPETVIGVNARYVLDALAACNGDEVEVGLSGDLDPLVVRAGCGDLYTGVVMPMRV